MIRSASHADIQRLIELATLLHATSSYCAMAFDPVKTGQFFGELIDGQGVVFVVEVDGVIVGGMAGGIIDQWFSHELIAYEYAVFVEPKRRHGLIAMKLINAFSEWARIKGARQMQMGIFTAVNVEGTGRLYESAGFRLFGPTYVKDI